MPFWLEGVRLDSYSDVCDGISFQPLHCFFPPSYQQFWFSKALPSQLSLRRRQAKQDMSLQDLPSVPCDHNATLSHKNLPFCLLVPLCALLIITIVFFSPRDLGLVKVRYLRGQPNNFASAFHVLSVGSGRSAC